MLASDLLATGVDWFMERTVGTAMNGVSFGPHSFSDLDFADDVAVTLLTFRARLKAALFNT